MARVRTYNVHGTQTLASPSDTVLTITATAAIQPYIFEIAVSCQDTPADSAILWTAQRFTAAGTGTAYTPPPLDAAFPAATTVCATDHTVEPTYTNAKILWEIALNQRNTHRWNFDPQGVLVIPATANNGIGLYATHASSTVTHNALFHFGE